MPTFAELIVEEYHSEVEVKWKLKSTNHAVAVFQVKSLVIEVDFEQRESNGPWHIGFNTVGGAAIDRMNLTLAFRVFNGVFQAIREFIETRQPDLIVFVAKDEDVASVYGAYLRREKSGIEAMGYSLQGPDRVEPYTQWTLRRMNPSAWKSN